MRSDTPHVSVCICTFCRPVLLERLLAGLAGQETNNEFTFEIVIADNDHQESAEGVVKHFVADSTMEVTYCVESRKSISYARNTALAHATGDYVAFIDDDESPSPEWLRLLLRTCTDYRAAGVFGPVRQYFETPPPSWVLKGGFYDRPEHHTGYVMPWRECRTGNVLLKMDAIRGLESVFSPAFGAGASDIDLFRRLIEVGHRFVWCNEAPVDELVPPNRWTRKFMLRRALLRGRISLLHPEDRYLGVAKSVVAVPVYTVALPFLQIVGHHHFMKYLVKICDHAGKLLALLHLNPIHERDM